MYAIRWKKVAFLYDIVKKSSRNTINFYQVFNLSQKWDEAINLKKYFTLNVYDD